VEKIAGV